MNFDANYELSATFARQRQERLAQQAAQVRQRRQIRQLRSIPWYGRAQTTAPPDDAA